MSLVLLDTHEKFGLGGQFLATKIGPARLEMLLFLVVHTKSSPARYKHQAYSENSTQHVKEQLLRGTVFGKGIPILATKKLSGGPNLAVKGGLGYHFGCHKKSPDRFDRATFGVTTLALFISHSPHCQCHSKLRNRRHFYVLL